MSSQYEYDQALRTHQEQIRNVLQAEQDLISLQKKKHALETGQDWPTQPHAPAHEEQQSHAHKEEESVVNELQVQVPEAPPSFHLQKLVIDLVEARNLCVLDNLLKLDPYILLNVGNERHQTPPFKNTGANPNFNHFQIHCPVANDVDCVHFQVWDKHKYLSDTILGRGQFSINNSGLRLGITCDTWVPLFKDGFKPAGEVHIVFIPHA